MNINIFIQSYFNFPELARIQTHSFLSCLFLAKQNADTWTLGGSMIFNGKKEKDMVQNLPNASCFNIYLQVQSILGFFTTLVFFNVKKTF